jgi:hypothetical protein
MIRSWPTGRGGAVPPKTTTWRNKYICKLITQRGRVAFKLRERFWFGFDRRAVAIYATISGLFRGSCQPLRQIPSLTRSRMHAAFWHSRIWCNSLWQCCYNEKTYEEHMWTESCCTPFECNLVKSSCCLLWRSTEPPSKFRDITWT